jgi:hypothetical protein
MEAAEAIRFLLLFVILPLWLAAGLADWACHRATDIATTSGYRESLFHLAMLAEAGVAVLAGLFLEITAAVLVVMLVAFILHEITALWDVSYSSRHRKVTPIEQHVHSFLEMLPLMALAFVAVLHWDQVRALVGPADADWGLRAKAQQLPIRYLATVLALTVLTNLAPFIEELARGLRVRKAVAAGASPDAAIRYGRTAPRSRPR